MRKAELEDHHAQYLTKEVALQQTVSERAFSRAFAICLDSLTHVIPVMQFRKITGITPEIPDFLCFNIICNFAPPLFAHEVLEAFHGFVVGTRKLARHEKGYLAASEAALKREDFARLLWDRIERHPGILKKELLSDTVFPLDVVEGILGVWGQLGVTSSELDSNDHRIFLRTRLDVDVVGACQACGVRGKGRKELFLEPVTCRKCASVGYYHILFRTAGS